MSFRVDCWPAHACRASLLQRPSAFPLTVTHDRELRGSSLHPALISQRLLEIHPRCCHNENDGDKQAYFEKPIALFDKYFVHVTVLNIFRATMKVSVISAPLERPTLQVDVHRICAHFDSFWIALM
jgi:hypothetical protein